MPMDTDRNGELGPADEVPREVNIRHNELLTVREVAVYLRVSRATVWRWCQQGNIPAFRVGRNWRIRRDELLALGDVPEEPERETSGT
jgi:excisionase family DNA binding protein